MLPMYILTMRHVVTGCFRLSIRYILLFGYFITWMQRHVDARWRTLPNYTRPNLSNQLEDPIIPAGIFDFPSISYRFFSLRSFSSDSWTASESWKEGFVRKHSNARRYVRLALIIPVLTARTIWSSASSDAPKVVWLVSAGTHGGGSWNNE